ncbi:MAG: bifunctional diaminohydroxyphosphoribosylaminopyrimidine deaminase/5-amino-6-(5-phosphoribosylamino)uracil reductase RibD [Planctomycetes bacterium]|nr:bifunctional diaminohydroxyphosphoribosylaminopyrimidine deaminase/5-amino-6-(5-phosphoribosylamino)uracil reductase RibD [Planctomycetota bacterium]
MTDIDEKFMLKALSLARGGIGSVEPNPAVGCVIVKDGEIIGQGWHERFGGSHAEINALEDCNVKGLSAADSEIYVTLEPCSHVGKTGPCTKAIIDAKPGKVIAAMADPSAHASGKGFQQLRDAGIEVVVGVCEEQAKLLNAAFIKFATTGRPWVILKWAQSSDGKMAWKKTSGQRWISNEKSRQDVHKLRSRVGGILVGIETVLSDDPLLTARPGEGKKLTRIVLDSKLRIPLESQLIATAKESPVLIVTTEQALNNNPQLAEKITEAGAEILTVPVKDGLCDLTALLDELGKRQIQQLLVEGGPTVITSFLREALADEVCIYISPKVLGSEGDVEISEEMAKLADQKCMKNVEVEQFDDDKRITGYCR